MLIGAYLRTTLIDYPGHIASVLFTKGCNMQCPYCHNKGLETALETIDKNLIFSHLEKRRGALEGVVISGGEPTLQPGLISFCEKVKALGYKIKLDTNGTQPLVLEKLIQGNLVDYIAMDFKASPAKYQEISGMPFSKIAQGYALVKQFPQHEFRTTLYPVLKEKDIEKIIEYTGKENLIIQQYRPNSGIELQPYTASMVQDICQQFGLAHRGVRLAV